MTVHDNPAEAALIASIALAPKPAAVRADTSSSPDVADTIDVNYFVANVGKGWWMARGSQMDTRQWLQLLSRSQVPVLKISVQNAIEGVRFGVPAVTANELIRRFESRKTESDQETLDDVTRALRTWRIERRTQSFETLFFFLFSRDFTEDQIPLAMSALSESYLIRDSIVARAEFREWLISKCNELITPERTQRIFARFA